MNAVVQDRYGSIDILELGDHHTDEPDDGVADAVRARQERS
jgi:hypothetical protein